MIKKNKKGWMKLVEAFFGILLIISIMGLIVESQYAREQKTANNVYEREKIILRDMQLNQTLRTEILGARDQVITYDLDFPEQIEDHINEGTPSHLDCVAKICVIDDPCTFPDIGEEVEKEIYAKSATYFADLNSNSRQLKLFCWIKEL